MKKYLTLEILKRHDKLRQEEMEVGDLLQKINTQVKMGLAKSPKSTELSGHQWCHYGGVLTKR